MKCPPHTEAGTLRPELFGSTDRVYRNRALMLEKLYDAAFDTE